MATAIRGMPGSEFEPRRGRVTSPTGSAEPRSKSGVGGQRKRGNIFLKQERIAWFRRSAYVQPLNFLREIDGTTYAVRAFFSEDARENITEKVQRIILKSDDNNKEV